MMTQYRFAVRFSDGRPVFASSAYPIYAWLLSQIPAPYGTFLHEQGQKPISQYLYKERETGQFIWTISCMDTASHEILAPILRSLHEIPLRAGLLQTSLLDTVSAQSMESLMELARKQSDAPFFHLAFRSPTSFKHDGAYVIFPETSFLIQSLAEKWTAAFPNYPLNDPEALAVFRQGLKITDYRLQSCRFSLKNAQIPACIGEIAVKVSLPSPMMELWKALVSFSRFSGVGIKTTLGMGGVGFFHDKRSS